MSKIDMGKAFPLPETKRTQATNKKYDVRITLNKSGNGKANVIRFGFINLAANALGAHMFVEASDVEYTKNRIYFATHDEKIHRNIHTLSSNGKTRQDSCYFSITPSEKAEKIYRMNWIGKTFPILYDEENGLYYIENAKEEN